MDLPFALGLDDLACATSAARFGELLCAPRPPPQTLPADPSAVSHHFARASFPDFASASAVTYSASELDAEPPAKRVRASPLEAAYAAGGAFSTAGGLSVESFSSSLADGSLSTALPSDRSSSHTHSPASSSGVYSSFSAPKVILRRDPQAHPASLRAKREPVALPAAADCARRTQHRETVKSHTRKCREKVNVNFERLLEALPTPPPGVEVKHKAQVLEYTIRVFRSLIARRAVLSVEIALSSPHAVARWASGEVAARAGSGGDVAALLEAFAKLYATKKGWKYAEVWTTPTQRAGTIVLADGDVKEKIAAFAATKVGGPVMVARAFAAKQAEWLPELHADGVAFSRAQAANQCGLRVALAVPVVMRDGTCIAVVLLADTEMRAYSTVEVAEVTDFVRLVGEAYGQHVAEENGSASSSGTSQAVGAAPAARAPAVKEEEVESKVAVREHEGFDIDAAFTFAGPAGHEDPVTQTPALAELFSAGIGDLRLFQGTELGGVHM